ncbi:MAG: FoF1 ATP synthase subunit gamma [Alphaproteobacteria bacterium]
MEDVARLQARIASLRELRGLFRAMRALAAAHMQEADAALGAIGRYAAVVEGAIGKTTALVGDGLDPLPPAAGTPEGADWLVVVLSEHGFTGALDRRLLDLAERERGAARLGLVGRRGAAAAAERGIEPAWSLPMATRVGGVLALARAVAVAVADGARVRIVHARPDRAGFAVAVRPVLPLDPALLADGRDGAAVLHHLDPAALLQGLTGEYLLAEIAFALMQALASENGARLWTMQQADRNIDDRLTGLVRAERAGRQEAVTAELLDVVTGADAVMH